jgi:hypothetical protein
MKNKGKIIGVAFLGLIMLLAIIINFKNQIIAGAVLWISAMTLLILAVFPKLFHLPDGEKEEDCCEKKERVIDKPLEKIIEQFNKEVENLPEIREEVKKEIEEEQKTEEIKTEETKEEEKKEEIKEVEKKE